eukprot:6194000-Pleurochrysis_carterae.AAC.2
MTRSRIKWRNPRRPLEAFKLKRFKLRGRCGLSSGSLVWETTKDESPQAHNASATLYLYFANHAQHIYNDIKLM